ncbi:MAG: pirin family protein [Idiomarina sp.]
MTKAIKGRFRGIPAQDGAGVKLTRVINQPALKHQDPFLMLDEFRSDNPNDYIAGFPPHPHRGFCTLTYMLAGRMEHQDSVGNTGVVEAGGAQWMKAAKGIIHAEMPKQEEGLMWGFQLWLNLPAKDKMSPAEWADHPSDSIPVIAQDGAEIRLVAGEYNAEKGPIQQPERRFLMADVRLDANTNTAIETQHQRQRLAYVYQGELTVNGEAVQRGELLQLDSEATLELTTSDETAAFILLAAEPIDEPIVQYGPFVMNESHEIEQALRDYQAGRIGAA